MSAARINSAAATDLVECMRSTGEQLAQVLSEVDSYSLCWRDQLAALAALRAQVDAHILLTQTELAASFARDVGRLSRGEAQ